MEWVTVRSYTVRKQNAASRSYEQPPLDIYCKASCVSDAVGHMDK